MKVLLRNLLLDFGKQDLPGCYQCLGFRLVRHNNVQQDSISFRGRYLFSVKQ